jgi:hypothetical protein
VLERFAETLQDPDNHPPVMLVHGVFGSGKSTLLVALILFAISVLKKAGSDARILVSSATNVALDNILQVPVNQMCEMPSFSSSGCIKGSQLSL